MLPPALIDEILAAIFSGLNIAYCMKPYNIKGSKCAKLPCVQVCYICHTRVLYYSYSVLYFPLLH